VEKPSQEKFDKNRFVHIEKHRSPTITRTVIQPAPAVLQSNKKLMCACSKNPGSQVSTRTGGQRLPG
jgi:hypothetical protein